MGALGSNSALRTFWRCLRVYIRLNTNLAGVEVTLSVPVKQHRPFALTRTQLVQRSPPLKHSAAGSNPEVQELRQRLREHGSLLSDWSSAGEQVTNELLWRWIKAKGSVTEAARCLLHHAQWRIDLGVVTKDRISSELAAEKVFMQGCDKSGRPVVIVLAARHVIKARNLNETKELITYTLETATSAADTKNNPLGQILCIFDLSGLGFGNLDTKALQAVFEVLQQHFPESLSELWFLNAPFIFWGLWRVVSPFIQPATRDKIKFLSGSERAARLEASIPAQVLPSCYGGQAELVPIERAALKIASQKAEAASIRAAHRVASKDANTGRLAAVRRVGGRAFGSSWGFIKAHNPIWAAKTATGAAKRVVLVVPHAGGYASRAIRRTSMPKPAAALSLHVQKAWHKCPSMPRPNYRYQQRKVESPHLAYLDMAAFYLLVALVVMMAVLVFWKTPNFRPNGLAWI